ncbi:MAG: hypothetical protein AAGB04_02350 [Pseudomonadota bacterium]
MAKVALAFFGITRSLHKTFPSIEREIIEPLRRSFDVSVYCHFFDLKFVRNERTREFGELNVSDAELLKPKRIVLEEPETCLKAWPTEDLKSFGSSDGDNYKSLENLIHQLHSLNRVSDLVLDDNFDICWFLRPDLVYSDELLSVTEAGLLKAEPRVYLPDWESWGGFNDRFALCVGKDAIEAYGKRVVSMLNFCRETRRPLSGELLLKYRLQKSQVKVVAVRSKASRLRITGYLKSEHFERDFDANSRVSKVSVSSRAARMVKYYINRTLFRFGN